MPRRIRDEKLETRSARLRLQARREPHWRSIQGGRAIGYRRLASKSGSWLARYYDPTRTPARVIQVIGAADDYAEADGRSVLTYAQALAKAADWFADLTENGGLVIPPMTVQSAMDAYLADYTARGGKDPTGLRTTIAAHIQPTLGKRIVGELTTAEIRKWHQALATAAPRIRSKATGTGKPATRVIDRTNPEATRARRATANRILTVLKAALNLAYADGRVASTDAWRKVKPFREADAPKVRFLDDAELLRLVNAATPEFRPMVTAALLTGCRYGELCGLCVADLDANAGAVRVRISKSGKARSVTLSAEGLAFFQAHAIGKAASDLLLTRNDGRAWGKSEQHRHMQRASKAAKITPAVSFHILRHAYAARLVKAGLPLGVVAAQLGHAEAICAKHYAHLNPGFVADAIRAAFAPLGVQPGESNVTPIRAR